MIAMSGLNDDFKLSFRSISEVYEAFGAIVARMAADKSIPFGRGGRKANRAAVLNALILWLDTRPPQEQKRIVGEGMAILNGLLEGEEAPAKGSDSEVEADIPIDPRPGKSRRTGA